MTDRENFEAWCKSVNPKYDQSDDSILDRSFWAVWQAAMKCRLDALEAKCLTENEESLIDEIESLNAKVAELREAFEFVKTNHIHAIGACVYLKAKLAEYENAPIVAWETYKGYLLHEGDPKVLEHSNPTPLINKPNKS
jgi:hypothetical protein